MILFCDEVGMASIFGMCMTSCVAIDKSCSPIKGVKDSKQVSKKKREELFPIITNEVQYAFGSVSPNKITKLNIFYARFFAMKIAVEKLARKNIIIDKIIVDGKFIIPDLNFPQEAVVKADEKYWACGAASILAKVKRDGILTKLGKIKKYSFYDLEHNAGYYSPKHREGIILHGPTTLHRENFEYFKYCLFCHEKYNEFLAGNKTYEEYLEYEKSEEKIYKKSFYTIWKEKTYDDWKPITYLDLGGKK